MTKHTTKKWKIPNFLLNGQNTLSKLLKKLYIEIYKILDLRSPNIRQKYRCKYICFILYAGTFRQFTSNVKTEILCRVNKIDIPYYIILFLITLFSLFSFDSQSLKEFRHLCQLFLCFHWIQFSGHFQLSL